ncbi:MAG: Gfo/Idh/MocA family oxidoreductase [Deltaproteobacteria bacterium]|nr:Gfo/Idh/MocA family oxidoreductase [Deltaproteobacteria bacterium]
MRTLKVAVVGVGYLGRIHALKYASMPQVDLIGLVDIDLNRAREIAQELDSTAYTDYRHIIDKVDAVSIAVPTTIHDEIAIPFLEQGVAVLLEKPMSASVEQSRKIIEAARKGNALLQIGHLERFNPALVNLAERITKPMFIEVHRISPFRERGTDVDVILDLMIHDIDIILSLVKSEIASLEAVGIPVLTESIDIANARIRFDSGCIANVTASRVSAEVMRKIRIFQPDSYISIDYAKSAVDIFTLGENKQILHTNLTISDSDALQAEIDSFLNALRTNTDPVVDGAAGLKAIEVTTLIKDSMIIPGK